MIAEQETTETTHHLPIFPDAGKLTHSSETKWKVCPRKYYLANVLGIRPAHNGDALRQGAAVHVGLEAFKNGGDESACENAVRDAYSLSECPPWLTPDKFAVEVETSVSMVRAYHRRWKDDQILNYLAVEIPFDLPIVNPDTGRPTTSFRSAGKIDAIASLPDGRIAIVEHKTTSDALDIDGDYWKRLALDGQISRYVLAARELEFDVQTTVYDVIRKPAIRPKNITKADQARAMSIREYFGFPLDGPCPERETPKMFGARLLADMTDRREFYFARNEVPRLESDLEEFKAEQWTIQLQIQDAKLKHRAWGASAYPRSTNACTFPFRCEYLDVCRGLKGDPTEQIPDGFRRVDVLHEELVVSEQG